MSRFGLITLAIFLAIGAGLALVVAMPCVTHRLYVVNEMAAPATFRVEIRGHEIWSGTLSSGEKRDVPAIATVGWSALNVAAVSLGKHGRDYSQRAGYVPPHPGISDYFKITLRPDGLNVEVVPYAFVALFDSEYWFIFSAFVLSVYNTLSCSDCLGFIWI